eukprot:CAMPEP_0201553168 /NCGR_PEP_ID=MMETSP0173_2-20130828/19482_1 /ASSEMBLY_ACC=CAM_ASM_000268 /TAXON_ID=218659 /ORGANISM="Vexillifera sp., Strain DIVA3 564/2" /LENGTH=341 /DNA_ID=CAMNT_0047963791 /DNA_START=32 /DNA_END=1057 /DNA_ORIENTATION=-
MSSSSLDLSESACTLTHHILSCEKKYPEASGEFSILLHSIEIACKYISAKVRAAGLFDLYGAQGSTNVQGEIVKKLDILANNAMITNMRRSRTVSLLVSEENEKPLFIEENPNGKYCVAFDPLDGSSNIDVNVTIGTIFGIFRRTDLNKKVSVDDIMQPGSKMVAAGYCMYGSATLMVLTTGNNVDGFTLDPTSGEFVHTHPNLKIRPERTIYSANEGNYRYWFEHTQKFVDHIKTESSKPYSLRYIGSMVGDLHRTLLYGGIFMYPGDTRAPNGKLRLLYEVQPMSFIIEKAGGMATTGTQRILDILPDSIHQRCPIYIGSKQQVSLFLEYAKKYPTTSN